MARSSKIIAHISIPRDDGSRHALPIDGKQLSLCQQLWNNKERKGSLRADPFVVFSFAVGK